MTYQDICGQNRFLYGELESLSHQINFIIASQIEGDTSALEKRKQAIMELITANLDKMEEIWEVESFSFRMARKKADPDTVEIYEPTEDQLQIIEAYKKEPNQSLLTLAERFGTTYTTVSRIITLYLSLKFKLVPTPKQIDE